MRETWKLLMVGLALLLFVDAAHATRWREALEQYELSTLTLMYTDPKHKCGPRASFKDPGGYLHSVFLGSYVGKNFGLIVEITSDAVLIKEVHQGKDGEWFEKPVRIRKQKNQP